MANTGGIFRHVSITLLGYGGQLVLTLAAAVLSAQLLGPQARGELAAIQMITLTLLAATSFGTPQALTFYTARDPERAGDLLGSRIAINLIACVPFILLGLGLQAYLLDDYRPQIYWMSMVYLAVVLPGFALFGAPTNTFLALKDYTRFTIMNISASTLYVAAILTAVVRPGSVSIAGIYMLLIVFCGIPMAALMYRKYVGLPVRFHWHDMRMMFGYAAYSFMSTLPQVVGQRLDQILVLAKLDAANLGLYTIAAGVGQMFQTLQLAAGNILLPYLAGQGTSDEGKLRMFGQVVRLTFILSTVLVTGLLIVLPILIPMLFGKLFVEAIPAAELLIVGAAIQGINLTISEGMRGLNLPKIPFYTELAGVVMKVVFLAGISFKGVTMELAAYSVLGSTLGVLVVNMALYHWFVEQIGFKWFLAGIEDVRLVWEHVRVRWMTVISRFAR